MNTVFLSTGILLHKQHFGQSRLAEMTLSMMSLRVSVSVGERIRQSLLAPAMMPRRVSVTVRERVRLPLLALAMMPLRAFRPWLFSAVDE